MHPIHAKLARLVLGTALAIVIALPAAAAQVGVFGTQVKAGDADHVPTTKADGIALKVNEAEFGDVGSAADNCLLIDTGSTAAAGAQIKDIRLTACMGKAAGSLIGNDDVAEKGAPYPNVVAVPVYADVNNNGKYDKGDYVYVTTGGASNLVATGATGVWSVRITPTTGGAAGTLVMSSDADRQSYGTAVKTFSDGPSVVEREDKQWYLVPRKTGNATIAKSIPKGSVIPADSIRLGGPTPDMPDVKAMKLEILTTDPKAGSALSVMVTIQNAGAASGVGLITVRFDDQMVDARLAGPLSPGQTSSMLLSLIAPQRSGVVQLKIGDVFQVLNLGAGKEAPDLGALVTRVDALELRLGQAESQAANVSVASDAGSAKEVQGGKAPTLNGVLALSVLGLAVVLRRRRD